MPRPTMDQVRGAGEFATMYQWDMSFVKFPQLAGGIGDYPSMEDVNIRCISSTIPVISTPRVTVNIRTHQVHQPGPVTYEGSLTLTFAETIESKISSMINAWREACAESKTGWHGLKREIEAIIKLIRLNRQNEPIWSYDLYGCWLESYTLGDLGGDPTPMQPSIVLAYDYFTEDKLA